MDACLPVWVTSCVSVMKAVTVPRASQHTSDPLSRQRGIEAGVLMYLLVEMTDAVLVTCWTRVLVTVMKAVTVHISNQHTFHLPIYQQKASCLMYLLIEVTDTVLVTCCTLVLVNVTNADTVPIALKQHKSPLPNTPLYFRSLHILTRRSNKRRASNMLHARTRNRSTRVNKISQRRRSSNRTGNSRRDGAGYGGCDGTGSSGCDGTRNGAEKCSGGGDVVDRSDGALCGRSTILKIRRLGV
jgi:hypothetical protein